MLSTLAVLLAIVLVLGAASYAAPTRRSSAPIATVFAHTTSNDSCGANTGYFCGGDSLSCGKNGGCSYRGSYCFTAADNSTFCGNNEACDKEQTCEADSDCTKPHRKCAINTCCPSSGVCVEQCHT